MRDHAPSLILGNRSAFNKLDGITDVVRAFLIMHLKSAAGTKPFAILRMYLHRAHFHHKSLLHLIGNDGTGKYSVLHSI